LQEDRLDNMDLIEIANLIDQKIEDIKMRFVDDAVEEAQ
jgi:hypothetical protein